MKRSTLVADAAHAKRSRVIFKIYRRLDSQKPAKLISMRRQTGGEVERFQPDLLRYTPHEKLPFGSELTRRDQHHKPARLLKQGFGNGVENFVYFLSLGQ